MEDDEQSIPELLRPFSKAYQRWRYGWSDAVSGAAQDWGSPSAQRVKETRAPHPGADSAQTRPLCLSTILRTSARPIRVPGKSSCELSVTSGRHEEGGTN